LQNGILRSRIVYQKEQWPLVIGSRIPKACQTLTVLNSKQNWQLTTMLDSGPVQSYQGLQWTLASLHHYLILACEQFLNMSADSVYQSCSVLAV